MIGAPDGVVALATLDEVSDPVGADDRVVTEPTEDEGNWALASVADGDRLVVGAEPGPDHIGASLAVDHQVRMIITEVLAAADPRPSFVVDSVADVPRLVGLS